MAIVLITDPDAVLQPYTRERQAAASLGAELVLHQDPSYVPDAEVIITSHLPITAEMMDRFSRCQMVARYGIGYDIIDVRAATARGIVVANTPTYGVKEVSDHTVGLILSAVRRIPWLNQQTRHQGWKAALAHALELRRLSELTLGIIGLGKIGKQVARKMGTFGCRILANDPYLSEETIRAHGAIPASLTEVLRTADVVTLHVPLNEETRHLIDGEALGMMKAGAILINTSRGRVVDEAALACALAQGQIATAALDVYETEPPAPNNPLLAMADDRVILTPHFAWASVEAIADQQREMAQAIASILSGEWPEATVNPEVQPRRPLRPFQPKES